ncbi:PAS domain-containing sensor histidine kinase [Litoreibacter roseus]|uniref:histidine kinase n=1 Tax=Litoreibacter roseus TaxID=2601869 RepID=A0A6N6JBP5_9RHOB|nr:PAS domain-containing sensor histidine kinase [Litoreibacter roseus]GFE63595.1 hypothetical protein KIN_06690 [Litoreibacter roseus]
MLEKTEKGTFTWQVTPDLLGILDKSGLFTHTNPAWHTTLGILPEDIENKPFFEFLHPDDIAAAEIAFQDIQNGQPILNYINRYRHADGSYRWLSWNAVPEGDRFFCSARDVTEAKENEAALQAMEEKARLREQFMAVLGHDLRNPLAAIGASARIAARQPQTEKSKEMLDAVGQSVRRMSSLIDDVMDFARARLGAGIVVKREDVQNLRSILARTVQEVRVSHPEATFREDYAFDEPMNCDPARISQLASNLVSNAVHHGSLNKPVRIKAEDKDGHFTLSVTNAGAAIPDTARHLLFEPFVRLEGRQDGEGLGLGLFIANEIAQRHGGQLSMSSDETETVFTFTMPRVGIEASAKASIA